MEIEFLLINFREMLSPFEHLSLRTVYSASSGYITKTSIPDFKIDIIMSDMVYGSKQTFTGNPVVLPKYTVCNYNWWQTILF